jgi:hypothetical protein
MQMRMPYAPAKLHLAGAADLKNATKLKVKYITIVSEPANNE